MFIKSLGGAALIASLAMSPAWANNDRNEHHERAPEHRAYHHGYGYDAPRYVNTPAPVYYAPPPRPPIVDFVIPLSFR